ncbi:MAG: hypothetical protein HKN89_06805 [Eudoraea sp.]|nr:hypothetical protein [Eudoraea sp.]
MKIFIPLLFCLSITIFSTAQERKITVKGIVTNTNSALEEVDVRSQKTGKSINTDEKGRYELTTTPGDILYFSYPGLATVEIILEDVTSVLNIKMNSELNLLDEVVLDQTRSKTQQELKREYTTNKNLINTAYGILDRNTSSGPLRIVDKSEMNSSGFDLASALIYRFPGIRVVRPPENFTKPTIYLRGSSNSPAIYDVDGVLLKDFPDFLLLDNIERVAVLNGLAIVAKYGGIARGGVIDINTKTGSNFSSSGLTGTVDKALLRNNNYEELALTQNQVGKNLPEYMKAFRKAGSEKEAIRLYREISKSYGSYVYFVLDAFNYFSTYWNNSDFADQILSEHWDSFKLNPVALKALAYLYQELGENEEAHEILREVFILRPNYAQSYRDLAMSYSNIGEYRSALDMYARYKYLLEEGFMPDDKDDFSQFLDRELCNFLALHGKSLTGWDHRKDCPGKKDSGGTFMVFEWNDGEAEFNLQFINPENRYFVWEHSLKADPERIRDEKIKGYSCQEFLVDGNLEGSWQVNLKYLGNKSLTPTYLKATIYYNYGTKAERQESKVFRVSLKDVSQNLFHFNNSSSHKNY